MGTKPTTEESALLSYAIGTEVDAVATYNYLLKHLSRRFRPVIKHIRDEEKEHIEELNRLLKGDTSEGDD
mgnify:CR=1 FL=1